jgi:hypothetical protein
VSEEQYRVPTVAVVSPDGYVIINVSDLTPQHVLYDLNPPEGSAPPVTVADIPAEVVVEAATYEAKHRGRGSYSIVCNGVEVVEGLTKLEAKAFNEDYSPAERAAFVANRAKR